MFIVTNRLYMSTARVISNDVVSDYLVTVVRLVTNYPYVTASSMQQSSR